MHISREDAMMIIDEMIKQFDQNKPISAQASKTYVWRFIKEIEQQFGIIWRDDYKKFLIPS